MKILSSGAKVHSVVEIYKGKAFRLHKERVTLPNGVQAYMDVIRHPGAAAVVPFLDRETLVLLRQYRHALGRFLYEIPAGTLIPGEDPLECARRELNEETGYQATRWTKLGEVVPVPGYSDERIHLFLAEGLVEGQGQPDPDEVLEVVELSLSAVLEMMQRGDLEDGKTLLGLLWALGRRS